MAALYWTCVYLSVGFVQKVFCSVCIQLLDYIVWTVFFMPACWCKLAISTECLTVTAIFSFNSQFDWYFNHTTLQEGEAKQGGACVEAFLNTFQTQFRKTKETDPKQIRNSPNDFYLRCIKENTQSHKQRCSWVNLMLLCTELISYFISKRDIKKAFPEVFHSSLMK